MVYENNTNILDSYINTGIVKKSMLDNPKNISEICEFIDSVIVSDREMFSERMVHLKSDIAMSLEKNFKGSKSELDFMLRRL